MGIARDHSYPAMSIKIGYRYESIVLKKEWMLPSEANLRKKKVNLQANANYFLNKISQDAQFLHFDHEGTGKFSKFKFSYFLRG
jgi:hypothetical protein